MALTPASALSALVRASSFFTGGAAAAAALLPPCAVLLPGPAPGIEAWPLGMAGGAAPLASAPASSSALPPRTCCSEEPEAEPWDSRLCPLSARLDKSSDSSAASCWRGEVEGGGGDAVAVAADAMSPIPHCLRRVYRLLLTVRGSRVPARAGQRPPSGLGLWVGRAARRCRIQGPGRHRRGAEASGRAGQGAGAAEKAPRGVGSLGAPLPPCSAAGSLPKPNKHKVAAAGAPAAGLALQQRRAAHRGRRRTSRGFRT